ncbi:hypothetical protein GJ744_008927 [Endocarpon pusillum]|uniref:Ankyrin repeat protein n=1 Tax=Endocarpon pusillum TaxID=364733 RepID=A0A8H7AQZ4_9EURO|nr:hypothetical protein GJ744_008927 [Endocarpon pusillum]
MKENRGATALHRTAKDRPWRTKEENEAEVQQLLEYGADVHMKDNEERTALDVAMVQLLEAAAAAAGKE